MINKYLIMLLSYYSMFFENHFSFNLLSEITHDN